MNKLTGLFIVLLIVFVGGIFAYQTYSEFRIDVPERHYAILIRKTGLDLENNQEVAPTADHKGLQLEIKNEGRYTANPYVYDWRVYPMIQIPENKMGVRVRLYGDDLPYANYVAMTDTQKGIVKEVLRPGRYAINAVIRGEEDKRPKDYVEIIELYEPIVIPAGFRGVLTNLAGPLPETPNTLLSPEGFRGVQEKALEPGTYYLNPYMYQINIVDCRSQRYNLGGSTGKEMGFPSKDGFWITLDGIVEFRVNPDKVAEFYVVYNDVANGDEIDEEIVQKIIMPNARSFCRLHGSNSSGRDFIGGETRGGFQTAFQDALRAQCKGQHIEIVQALVTKIIPPEAIADPVRRREVAHQRKSQFIQEELQQKQEALLATEKALVLQKQQLVQAQQEVNSLTTKAEQDQEVAVTLANQRLEVAKEKLEAAKDEAASITAAKRAEAAIINFQNEADAAGWKKAVEAFNNDGNAYAQYVMHQKLAPSFRSIMSNTADSPLMKIFENFNNKNTPKVVK
jgi:regulator of protease activity HflC (stomatin/prohibitin superfamily)